jgi:hypothetical protein
MKALVVLVALAAAVTLSSVATAGPEVARQWVEITATGPPNPSGVFRFGFAPGPGALKADSGTETSVFAEHVVRRGGQSVNIVDWTTTSKGKRGTLVILARIEHVAVGNYHVGTGTWKVLRGTGQYAKATGGGRVLNAFLTGQNLTERREGFLTVR